MDGVVVSWPVTEDRGEFRGDDPNLPPVGTRIRMAQYDYGPDPGPVEEWFGEVVAAAGASICVRYEDEWRAHLTVYGMSSEFEYWFRVKPAGGGG